MKSHIGIPSRIAVLGILAMVPGFAQTRITRILPLAPNEGVFAYSRISPDGRLLSYASEIKGSGNYLRTMNVIDLATKQVQFTEPGMDAFWSPDGTRLIYLYVPENSEPMVRIWNRKDGSVVRDAAPENLGHYFSWGRSGGKDVILTQDNNYYYLEGNLAQRPYLTVPVFPPFEAGAQPMISKDGKRLATFYRGTLLVRSLDEPGNVVETRLTGGKADFSYDGRYIAFHRAQRKDNKDTYQIQVVDLKTKEVIQVTDLPGSCYYPSWTRDGRLAFRYDSDEYRGFVFATGFLKNRRAPLPTSYPDEKAPATILKELFGRRPMPNQRVVVVNFWAGWCVHCRAELPVLNRLRKSLRSQNADVEIIGACDPTSFKSDRDFILQRSNLDIPQISISSKEVNAFRVQVYPTTLFFIDGTLAERRHGALTESEFRNTLTKLQTTAPSK